MKTTHLTAFLLATLSLTTAIPVPDAALPAPPSPSTVFNSVILDPYCTLVKGNDMLCHIPPPSSWVADAQSQGIPVNPSSIISNGMAGVSGHLPSSAHPSPALDGSTDPTSVASSALSGVTSPATPSAQELPVNPSAVVGNAMSGAPPSSDPFSLLNGGAVDPPTVVGSALSGVPAFAKPPTGAQKRHGLKLHHLR
ncbi:hypothetical protein BDQ17DRAFT_1409411 [Cyathus striatus]|nr:hypothetical protein BDQ17DRAFT_1409411 [Cyathus striatus]